MRANKTYCLMSMEGLGSSGLECRNTAMPSIAPDASEEERKKKMEKRKKKCVIIIDNDVRKNK